MDHMSVGGRNNNNSMYWEWNLHNAEWYKEELFLDAAADDKRVDLGAYDDGWNDVAGDDRTVSSSKKDKMTWQL